MYTHTSPPSTSLSLNPVAIPNHPLLPIRQPHLSILLSRLISLRLPTNLTRINFQRQATSLAPDHRKERDVCFADP